MTLDELERIETNNQKRPQRSSKSLRYWDARREREEGERRPMKMERVEQLTGDCPLVLQVQIDAIASQAQRVVRNAINRADISSRQKMVLLLRYGFFDGEEWSLSQIGELINLSGARIRQILLKAKRDFAPYGNRERLMEAHEAFLFVRDHTE